MARLAQQAGAEKAAEPEKASGGEDLSPQKAAPAKPEEPPLRGAPEELAAIAGAAAEDLRLLALLHGGELTTAMAEDLQKGEAQQLLALQLSSKLAAEALVVLNEGVQALDVSERGMDLLAADFSDIYLTHRLQISPSESPWLDEDGLANGAPMFEVRGWYEHYGLAAENWRVRADDHLSLQLTFIAHLLSLDPSQWRAAVRFMDEHLLRWLEDFCQGVAQRCATPFYAGLAMLTFAYMDELRAHMETITGEARRRVGEQDEAKDGQPRPADVETEIAIDGGGAPFPPGFEPGW